MIEFTVYPERIVAQPRIKARRRGNFVQVYTPQGPRIATYKALIAETFMQVAPEGFVAFKGPLRLSITYSFKRPAARMRESEFHSCKPDDDNILKSFQDALNGIAWHDDSQICDLHLTKRWAPTYLGGKSGRKLMSDPSSIYICIEPLENE